MIVTGESEVLGGKLPSPPTSHLQLLILVHLPDLSPDVGKDVMWVDFRLPMGWAAFFSPVVSCSTQRLSINMAIYFFWPQVPVLVTTAYSPPWLAQVPPSFNPGKLCSVSSLL